MQTNRTPWSVASARLFLIWLLTGCCAFFAGCATSRTPAAASSEKNIEPGEPQLYLLPAPHSRLYVEVDAVAGCWPSDATLNDLRDFLRRYCDKPGGIEIVRSDLIPIQAARGIRARALARRYLNGPPKERATPPPAFLHVLFYDSALSKKTVTCEAGHPGVRMASRLYQSADRPHTDLQPYPMIFMNTRYIPKLVTSLILQHEAGHALGLAGRSAYASGHHCLDPKCLMFETLKMRFHLGRLLMWRDPLEIYEPQRQICARCADQLAGNLKQARPANLRFNGPVLVRSEDGYHVLNLPHRVKVILGTLTDNDCWAFAAAVRAESPASGGSDSEMRVDGQVKGSVLDEPGKIGELIARAEADPLEPVRDLAPKFWVAQSERLCAKGQFADAVEVCRQAIQANPQDDLIYNHLAWIKATCADPSVRDGKESISAARKACELAQWKEWNWIDTLAAAYAEAGDFKQAVKFQEQALRTGDPSRPEREQMLDRMSLYRQSRPFREIH